MDFGFEQIEPMKGSCIDVLDALTLSILRPSPAYEAVVECGRMSLIECRLICQERLNEVSGDLAESIRSSVCFAEQFLLDCWQCIRRRATPLHILLLLPVNLQDHRHLIAEDRGRSEFRLPVELSFSLSMTFQWSHVSHLVLFFRSQPFSAHVSQKMHFHQSQAVETPICFGAFEPQGGTSNFSTWDLMVLMLWVFVIGYGHASRRINHSGAVSCILSYPH